MADSSDAYEGCCPDCGRTFTLADLKRMAVGDGWQRYIVAHLPDGTRVIVKFDDFDPVNMKEVTPAQRVATEASASPAPA